MERRRDWRSDELVCVMGLLDGAFEVATHKPFQGILPARTGSKISNDDQMEIDSSFAEVVAFGLG